MTAILFVLAVVVLLGYALERNHRRQVRIDPGLSGSTTAENRDLPRVTTDLQATAAHTTPTDTPTTAHTAPTRTRVTSHRPAPHRSATPAH